MIEMPYTLCESILIETDLERWHCTHSSRRYDLLVSALFPGDEGLKYREL